MQKKIITYLFIFYTLFIVYNTLIPFQFTYGIEDLHEQIGLISWTPYFTSEGRVSLVDIAGNIILFVPFGFLLYMLMSFGGRKHIIIITLLAGAVLSFLIEFIQLFIAGRNSAPHDLINNALGSWMGAVVAAVYSTRIAGISRRIFYDLLETKPFALIVVIIAVAQSFSAIMPFTVSISVSSFLQSVKKSNIIPFDYQSIGKLFLDSPNNNDFLGVDYTLFFENLLFWIIVGYLVMLCYRLYWKNYYQARILMAVLPAAYFCLLEFAQLFIISRTTDINDIISSYAGVVLGYLSFSIIQGPAKQPIVQENLDQLRIPLGLYTVFILFAGLRPFDWTLADGVVSRALSAENLIPFYAYFRTHSLWNIFDLINSILYFMPLSLFWSYKLRGKGVAFAPIYFRTVSVGLLIGAAIELSQVFSVSRVAEITDILSYGLGGAVGTFFIYYYEREIQPALAFIQRV